MKAISFAVVLFLSVFPSIASTESQPLDAPAVPLVSDEINKINLNTADVTLLNHSFKGIGKKRAEAIIAYREANGPFKSISDLGLVKGIGKQFIVKNLEKLQDKYVL